MGSNTTRILFAKSLLFLAAFSVIPTYAQEKLPNIVMICVDDLRPLLSNLNRTRDSPLRSLIDSPNKVLEIGQGLLTPNLDRIAELGITFSDAYTSSPRCNPSRAAILTGIQAFESGYHIQNGFTFRGSTYVPLAQALTIPQMLEIKGYQTIGLGKVFHRPNSDITQDWTDDLVSWNNWINVPVGTLEDTKKSKGSYKNQSSLAWGVEKRGTKAQPDTLNAVAVKALLQTGNSTFTSKDGIPQPIFLPPNQVQPFFLAVGLAKPHSPWSVPQAYINKIPKNIFGPGGPTAQIHRLAKDTQDLSESGLVSLKIKKNTPLGKLGAILGIPPSEKIGKSDPLETFQELKISQQLARTYQDAVAHYLACVAYADAQIGEILEGLLAGPYATNTILIVWSDHGYHLGDKLHIGKTTLYEPSLRSLFLIADLRGNLPANKIITTPVSLTDIKPTIDAITGSRDPLPTNQTQNFNLIPLIKGQKEKYNNRLLIASLPDNDFAVRYKNWKYISYGEGTDKELYDLKLDPTEEKNLMDPENRKKFSSGQKKEIKEIINQIEQRLPEIL